MKKNIIYLAALVITVTSFVSCKKDDTTTATVAASSTFAVRGTSFTTPVAAGYTSFQAVNGFGTLAVYGLTSDNKGKSIVYMSFYNTAKPAAGVYSVVTGSPAANQVSLAVTDSVSIAKQGLFGATGTDNVKATVSVNAAGKLSVTLPTTQLSGSNFDNTNPSNTVITTITTTVAGTFNEQ